MLTKKVFIVFLFIAVSCANDINQMQKKNETILKGVVEEDTELYESQDYVIEGELIVKESVKLTINPNVKIIIKSGSSGAFGKIIVYGILVAEDNDSTDNIKIINNSENEDNIGLELAGLNAKVKLQNVYFEGFERGVVATNSKIEIRNCIFTNCRNGITINRADSTIVVDNTFNNNYRGLVVEFSNNYNIINISDNNFVNCSGSGAIISNQSVLDLSGNYFERCSTGITILYGAIVGIFENKVIDCDTGITYGTSSYGNCSYCNIERCNIGIQSYRSEEVKINYNNIIQSIKYAIIAEHYEKKEKINAKENWWGTIVEKEIEDMIFDIKDNDNNNIEVDFLPIAKERY